jgi:phosphoglycerate kinase
MPIKSIKSVKNLRNKRVMVRVDFNVPVKRGKVMDDTRLHASIPTLKYLIKAKAKVVIVTHLGRPDGKKDRKLKLDPVAKKLGELLGKKVKKLPRYSGIAVEKQISGMKGGQVVMLENIRFSPDEKKNTGELGKELAGLVDLFVLDGFAVAHRSAASVVGVPSFIPSYAGLLLEQEIKGLERITKKPKHPLVVVIGGAKTETKIPVIKNLLPKADHILIGGAILNTYLASKGYGVGASLVDNEFKKQALEFCSKRKIIVPADVVVGDKEGKNVRVVEITKNKSTICNQQSAIYDIGPATMRLFAPYIKKAQTLVWNGALGLFENKSYAMATLAAARLVASRSKGKAYGVIGGGETIQAMGMVGMTDDIDLISTGGGAMLEFLSGKDLPGIKAIM